MLNLGVYGTPYSSTTKTHQTRRPSETVDAEDDDDDNRHHSPLGKDKNDAPDTSDVEAPKTSADWETQEMECWRWVLETVGVIARDSKHDYEQGNLSHTLGVAGGSDETRWGADGARVACTRSSIGAAPDVPLLKTNTRQLLDRELPPLPPIDALPNDTESSARTTDNTTPSFNLELPIIRPRPRPRHLSTSPDTSGSLRIDDAFGRYETYRRKHGSASSANRMSVVSLDTPSLTMSSPRSLAVSLAPSLREQEPDRAGESRTSLFLSFLGRHTGSSTQEVERDRKTLLISGPICASPSSAGGMSPGESDGWWGDEGSAFGTSWASLLGRGALEGIPKVERKRQEAIFELVSTEADYVRDLQLVVEVFYSPLIRTLGEASTSVIFCNIEDILLTNTAFLSALEERQRDCRLYIDHIGDLLQAHIPNMRVYLDYCVNQANAGKVLKSMRDSNPDLAATLQRLREDPTTRNLDLSSYLLVPMQRLTRYPLLIKQILQYTDPPTPLRDSIESPSSPPPQLTLSFPSEHEERGSIANALSCAERILEEVNETIRERDSRARLGEVSKRLQAGKDPLDLTLPTHHLGPRRLIKEGVLAKAKSGRKLRVLLCSDILLLLNESAMSLYRVPLPVHELEIHFSHGLSCDDNTVRIHRTYLRWREALVLRAPSVLEARAWTEAIIQAAAKAKAGVMAAVGNHGFGIGMGHVASGGSRPSMDLVGDGSPGVNT